MEMTNKISKHIEDDVNELLNSKSKLQDKLRADELRSALDQASRTMDDMKGNKDILLEHKNDIQNRERIAEKELKAFQAQLEKFPANDMTKDKLDEWPPTKPEDYAPVK
jgi:hypothetical protein